MNNKQIAEITELGKQAVVDAVKAQIAAGAESKGMTGARQADVLARTIPEMLDSFPAPEGEDDSKWQRNVLRVFFNGTGVLNASQLRQTLEKAGVLEESKAAQLYGTE
jgi:hypothetical protein